MNGIRSDRFCFLSIGLCLLAVWGTGGGGLHARADEPQSVQARPGVSAPIIGAIRWDGWHSNRSQVGLVVENTLGPREYHFRLPFYAKIIDDGHVQIDGTAQEIVDREIDYAAAAGLDYWGFVTYDPKDALSLGLQRYLQSKKRNKINFCLVTEYGRWRNPAFVERIADMMRSPSYQKVLGNRSLLYLGFVRADTLQEPRQIEAFRRVVDGLRERVVNQGLEQPYIVLMDFSPEQGRKWAEAFGADALSSYAIAPGGGTLPYARLAESAEKFWDQCKAQNKQVVPIIMTGWDRRPRIARPHPWEPWQKPGVGMDNYYEQARPEEIAAHTENAVKWIKTHRAAAEAQTAIIYAWNEFDEGGWLAPTLKDGDARLRALAKVLKNR